MSEPHEMMSKLEDILRRVAALEDEMAANRTLNEELFLWFESDCSDPISESLAKALEKFVGGKTIK